MNTRSRFVRAIVAIAAGVAITACADKVFRPPQSVSPKIQLQFSAIGAQVNAGSKKQVLVAAAAYVSSVVISEKDSFRIIAGPVVVPVTGTSAQITLNVDLTGCLADPTRKGSQSACSLYYGVWLHDSATFTSDSDFTKGAYDYAFVGPIDVVPGKAPTLAPISVSNSRLAIYQFVGDETMRLGGPLTPNFFSGPITGSTAGLAVGSAPVLYGLTNGYQLTSSCTSSQSNCQPNGFNAAQLAIFQNGTWTRVSGPQSVQLFNDVTALSPTDVYLGSQSGLFHYDGTSITQVSAVSGAIASIGSSSSGGAKYVIVGSANGSTWIGYGTSWQQYTMPANSATINNVCITGPNEAFASSTNNGGLYRFNGSTWTQVLSSFNQPKGDLQCPAPGQAFVWAQNTALLSWNGSGWSTLPNVGRTVRLAVVSPTEIYAAGDSAQVNRNFYRFDGTSWHLIATSQYTQPMQYRPWADPRGGAAYFASPLGRVEQVTGTSMRPISYSPSIRDAIMTSVSNAFAIGYNMFLARWNGGTWTVDPPPTGTNTARIMNGVFSDGPSNAWAVGGFSTIIHWNGTKWSVVGDSVKPASSTRDLYTAVWGTGGTVWIAGASSILRCTSVSSCTPDPVTGIDSLFGIWGSSATNAWAVGAHGKIMHFDGTQWTSVATPTSNKLVRVWGSSASSVWALGDSALVHYDGTAWTIPAYSGDIIGTNGGPPQSSIATFQLGLFGFGPNEVYFASPYGNIRRWDGLFESDVTSTSENGGGRIVAISGYVGGCGIALIDGLVSGYASTFLRGVGPAGCLASPMPMATPWP